MSCTSSQTVKQWCLINSPLLPQPILKHYTLAKKISPAGISGDIFYAVYLLSILSAFLLSISSATARGTHFLFTGLKIVDNALACTMPQGMPKIDTNCITIRNTVTIAINSPSGKYRIRIIKNQPFIKVSCFSPVTISKSC